MKIRSEVVSDIPAINQIITTAFTNMPYSNQNEAGIVEALRNDGALAISLVAVDNEKAVGYIAFSEVSINDQYCSWYGLGPVAVLPDYQKQGIGQMLIREGLDKIQYSGAKGCVLVGAPQYYGRFGFVCDPALTYPGLPPEYFQRLAFSDAIPKGEVRYHAAFASG